MKRRRVLTFVVLVALVLGLGYIAVGAVAYSLLTSVDAKCAGEQVEANTPASFTIPKGNSTPYLMKNYEAVSFPSRDKNITISGWFVPAQTVDPSAAPAIILVHGVGSCKHSPYILLPAGMLNRNGFNVLMIDLRNHGDSTVEDGRYSAGVKEYKDVLGAWDWLTTSKGIPAERIGLFGTSLGAATVIDAMGEEPRVAATWADSSFSDLQVAINAELDRNHIPRFLEPAGILGARLMSGVDITSISPLKAVSRLNGRSLFITHGDKDSRLSVQYAYDLANAIHAQGGAVTLWIVPGSDHIEAMNDHTEEYETRLVQFFTDSFLVANV